MKVEVRPNIIDRAVNFVSPAAGMQRMEARTRLAASTAMFGGHSGYRGAQADRTQRRGVSVRPRSANADTIPGSGRLRAAQRDAAMNQPLATGALNRITTFTIGTGLMLIPSVNAEVLGLTAAEKDAWELRLATDFDAYMQSTDVDAERTSTGYGQQEVSYRGAKTSGDIIALRVMPDDQPGRAVLTAWKLVEADRLVNPPGVMEGGVYQPTGNRVAGGVEVDSYSAPVAYHILKQHPGDLGLQAGSSMIPERIEAWDRKLALPRVIHLFKKERAEQFRGVGMLAPVLEQLRMGADLTDAELFAAVLSSMLAVVYKSPGAGAMPEPDYGDGTEDGGAPVGPPPEPNQYKFEPGTTLEIDTDAEVEIKSPGRPNSAFDPFFMAIARQVGAATGIPLGVLMLMFNSSYTASKAEIEAFYRLIYPERTWFGDTILKPIYVCFLAEKIARGDYVMPGYFSDPAIRAAWTGVEWRGDGKITLNPQQEANGFKIQQDNGWKTGEQITAELTGGSYRENIRKRGAEHRAWVAEGLPVPAAPGAASAKSDDGSDDKKTKEKEDE